MATIPSEADFQRECRYWKLKEVLGVDQVISSVIYDAQQFNFQYAYVLVRNGNVVLRMSFDPDVPLQDRVTTMKVALRMQNGNNHQG